MALVLGTNCGFVSTRPTVDPGESSNDFVMDDSCVGGKFTSPSGSNTLSEVGWWCRTASEAANFQVGIYSHDAGNDCPGSRLAVSSDTAKGTGNGWKYASLSYALSASTTYWLCVQLDNTSTTTYIEYIFNASYRGDTISGYSALPDPWVFAFNANTYLMGIYGVYAATSSGTPVYYLGV